MAPRPRARRIARSALLLGFLALGLPGVGRGELAAPVVPGRIVLELTDEGLRAGRGGRLDLPFPAGAAGREPRLEPLFTSRTGRLARIWVLTFRAGPAADDAEVLNGTWIDAVTRSPHVLRAESDLVLPVAALPDDPYLEGAPLGSNPDARQFHLYNPGALSLEATRAWPFLPAGREAVVAILDSGVDWRHPDLGGPNPPETGVFWRNAAEWNGLLGVDDDGNTKIDDVIGWDFVNVAEDIPGQSKHPQEDALTPDNDPSDFAGHGTQVAGFVTALSDNGTGIAGGGGGALRLMPVRVGWATTTLSAVVYMSYCAQGLEYAALNGARVANCSWDSQDSFGLGAALDFAIGEHDMVIVGSAGNGSTSSTGIEYLAARPDCVGVAALLEDGRKASFSNYGSWVDLAAFGKGMVSTHFLGTLGSSTYLVNGAGGTSFSSPMVAGLAGLLRALDPAAGAAAVRARLAATARPLDDVEPIYADRLGGGLADYASAVQATGGGWDRAGRAERPTPFGATTVAVLTDTALTVLDAALGTPVAAIPQIGRASSPLLPAAADFGIAGVFLLAGDGSGLRAFDAAGVERPGFPVPLPGGAVRLLAVDLDGDGVDEALASGTDSVLVVDAGGGIRFAVAAALRGVAAGDFDPARAGLEWGGPDGDGRLRIFDAGGAELSGSGAALGLGPVAPVAVEFDGNGTAVLVAAGTEPGSDPPRRRIHAWENGSERLGFPVTWEGEPVAALSATGFTDEPATAVVAVDAAGGVRVIRAEGTGGGVAEGAAGAPAAGEVLSADVDGDYRPDLVLLTADGRLLAWSGEMVPLAGFPRRFPAGAGEAPVLVDAGERRFVVVADTAGAVWSLPVGPSDRPAPWPAARGGGGRAGGLDFDAATPAEPATTVTWAEEGSGGRVCWRGAPEWAVSLRLRDAGTGSVLWVGPALAEDCRAIEPGDPAQVVLEGRGRAGAWIEVGRVLAAPPARVVLGAPEPNPAAGDVRFDVASPGGGTLTIHDVQGRRVRRIEVPAAAVRIVWDGRGNDGRAVAPGVYVVVLRAGTSLTSRRLVRLP